MTLTDEVTTVVESRSTDDTLNRAIKKRNVYRLCNDEQTTEQDVRVWTTNKQIVLHIVLTQPVELFECVCDFGFAC